MSNDKKPDYEKLGKAMNQVFLKDYVDFLQNTPRQIFSALIRGIFMGFGTVLGATVLVAIAIWLLQALGGIPLIGQWLEDAGNTVKEQRK